MIDSTTIDQYLNFLIQTYGAWVYGILFGLILIETGVAFVSFLPSETVMFAIGALASRTSLEIVWLYGLLTLACILGDSVNYGLGKLMGPLLFNGRIRFFKKEYLERAHSFYRRYGDRLIFAARFLPIFRTFIPIVAGSVGLSYWRFLVFNSFGGIVWAAVFIFGGYFFGNLPLVKQNFSWVGLAIISIWLLPLIFQLLKQFNLKTSADL
jgi:membrane-associated protein